MITDKFRTVLITGMRAPVAMDMARNFHSAGWRVIGADVPSYPIGRFSNSLYNYRKYAPPATSPKQFKNDIRSIIDEENINLVIPTCEEVFYLGYYTEQLDCEIAAPNFDSLEQLHNKGKLAQISKGLSIGIPKTIECKRKSELGSAISKIGAPYVVKPTFSRFATDTIIKPTQNKLEQITPTRERLWVCQEFIEGTEACIYAVAYEGKLTAIACYYPKYRAGKGSGIYFTSFRDIYLKNFCENFAGKHQLTGQFSFDVIQTKTGEWYLLECNPRTVSGLHFFRDHFDFNLCFTPNTQNILEPIEGRNLAISSAMATIGLPTQMMGKGKVTDFLKDWWLAEGIISSKGDRIPALGQYFSLLETALKALLNRRSPLKEATSDIEWNGEEIPD